MRLYPRLLRPAARRLATLYATRPLGEVQASSATSHPAAIFAPTGGQRVDETLLQNIQQEIRTAAEIGGYPHRSDESSRRRFDAHSGELLHTMMDLAPSEASHEEMWAFVGCVLLPDVVRWRFPGGAEGTTAERFLGGFRGLRNTCGRAWWRAQTFRDHDRSDPYRLLYLLGEDELVQITERPNLAGNPSVARQLAESFLAAVDQNPQLTRSELLRDAMKRLRRLFPIVSFDLLESQALQLAVNRVFAESARSLVATPARVNEPDEIVTPDDRSPIRTVGRGIRRLMRG